MKEGSRVITTLAVCPLSIEFSKVIEPLRELYKDEVRDVAEALGLPGEIAHRMPFPGPGLSVRVVGAITREAIEVVREANAIVEDILVEKYRPWQCLAALVGLGTGVKGDNRLHGWIVAVRAVNSRDGMTADPIEITWEDPGRDPGSDNLNYPGSMFYNQGWCMTSLPNLRQPSNMNEMK